MTNPSLDLVEDLLQLGLRAGKVLVPTTVGQFAAGPCGETLLVGLGEFGGVLEDLFQGLVHEHIVNRVGACGGYVGAHVMELEGANVGEWADLSSLARSAQGRLPLRWDGGEPEGAPSECRGLRGVYNPLVGGCCGDVFV